MDSLAVVEREPRGFTASSPATLSRCASSGHGGDLFLLVEPSNPAHHRRMDLLSDVLRTVNVSRVVFGAMRHLPPWGLRTCVPASAAFHIIIDGSAWVTVGDLEPIQVHAGDILLISGGVSHTLQDELASPIARLPELLERRVLIPLTPGEDLVGTTVLCGAFSFDDHPLVSMLPSVIRVRIDDAPSRSLLKTTISAIVEEVSANRIGGEALVDQLSGILLIELVRAQFSKTEDNNGWLGALRDPQIGRALGAIHDRPEHGWTLAELATQVGLSRSSFAHRFKELVGDTPMQYVTRWRMQRAAFFLRAEPLTVQEVMLRVGYGSEATFSRAFKRWIGKAPAAYRRSQLSPGDQAA